ncbi:hypothetical protein IPM19_01430 [bacterium]|nr:MAG: hypothetical protein IPM19_01430 [bacterium]
MGILAFGALMYWKTQLYMTTEYVELQPTKHTIKHRAGIMKSSNYQLEEVEVSPSVQ